MANYVEVGETDAAKANPTTVPSFTGTLADGVHVLGGMGNALTVETQGGIVQMDTGPAGQRVEKMLDWMFSHLQSQNPNHHHNNVSALVAPSLQSQYHRLLKLDQYSKKVIFSAFPRILQLQNRD